MQKYNKKFIAEENEEARARNLQRYQFLNLLSSSMFRILRQDELSEATVKLLRASPKLWPLLKGETHDLGHPDDAGGYAIIKAYLQQFREYESQHGFTPPMRAVLDIRNRRTCSLWEQEKLRNDAALFEAHFTRKTRFIPFKGLGCPGNKGIVIESTPFESGLWEQDLPYPTFLQPTSSSAEVEEVIFLKEPSFF